MIRCCLTLSAATKQRGDIGWAFRSVDRWRENSRAFQCYQMGFMPDATIEDGLTQSTKPSHCSTL